MQYTCIDIIIVSIDTTASIRITGESLHYSSLRKVLLRKEEKNPSIYAV